MQVIFIRHASAAPAGADGDEARQLNEEGKAQAVVAAKALKRLGAGLELILTSPLLRAVQTAGIIAEVHGGPDVEQTQLLAPPADAAGLRSRLAQLLAQGIGTIGIVGHAPSLDDCIGVIVAARPKIGLSLSKAGAACVQVPDEWPNARAELRWLMRREQLEILTAS